MQRLSVIIPAFNEERFLGATLEHILRAKEHVLRSAPVEVEILVVDNGSTDGTAAIAREHGAEVLPEPVHNIARVRNAGAGAGAAKGAVLVFIDADTLIPENLFTRIAAVMADPACLGGAVDTEYRPARPLIRVYLRLWRILGLLSGMAQGATQFCRSDAFSAVGGYDETLYMGEDVDFYWRLGQWAKRQGCHLRFIRELRVVPSCRRFDRWPLWRTLVWTNPLVVALFSRRRSAWRGWYSEVPR